MWWLLLHTGVMRCQIAPVVLQPLRTWMPSAGQVRAPHTSHSITLTPPYTVSHNIQHHGSHEREQIQLQAKPSCRCLTCCLLHPCLLALGSLELMQHTAACHVVSRVISAAWPPARIPCEAVGALNIIPGCGSVVRFELQASPPLTRQTITVAVRCWWGSTCGSTLKQPSTHRWARWQGVCYVLSGGGLLQWTVFNTSTYRGRWGGEGCGRAVGEAGALQ